MVETDFSQRIEQLRRRATENTPESASILVEKAKELIDWDGLDKRYASMVRSLLASLPEFIILVPPTPQANGLYRRIRHIQNTGECCGFAMNEQELKEIIGLAGRESVHNALAFLCRVLDKLHVERTLKTAQNRLQSDNRLEHAAAKLGLVGKQAVWTVKYWQDLVRGRYSEADLYDALEIALRKKSPAGYFTACLKNGLGEKSVEMWKSKRKKIAEKY